MPLTPMDEYPHHQMVSTFDHVSSSDPRWTDGFGGHLVYHPEGEVSLVSGISLYPNLNVLDGYVCIIHEGKQHSIRMSRSLRPDIGKLAVGPLHWHIIEGMKTLRIALDKNQTGMECDIEFDCTAPPYEEPHYFSRHNGRTVQDFIRVTQVGGAGGFIRINGKSYELDKSKWLGVRTRRWGIRQNGGPENYAPQAPGRGQGHWIWAVLQAGPYWMYWSKVEDPDGETVSCDGIIGYVYGDSRPVVKLRDVEQEIERIPGTHGRMKAANLTFVDVTGKRWPCRIETLSPGWDIQGWGYGNGWKDQRGLGAVRGDYFEESDVWDVSHPENIVDTETGKSWTKFYREFLVRVNFEGFEGRGDVAHVVGPKYKPFGFV